MECSQVFEENGMWSGFSEEKKLTSTTSLRARGIREHPSVVVYTISEEGGILVSVRCLVRPLGPLGQAFDA